MPLQPLDTYSKNALNFTDDRTIAVLKSPYAPYLRLDLSIEKQYPHGQI